MVISVIYIWKKICDNHYLLFKIFKMNIMCKTKFTIENQQLRKYLHSSF